MLPVIEKLLVLQDRDRRLIRVRAEVAAVAPQRQALTAKAARANAGLDAARKRAQQIESDRKKLELEVETLKERISKVRAQQNDTRSNEQYRAYQHQIETTEGEIRGLEDRQIEFMEQAETAGRDLAAATRAAAEAKGEADRHLADLADREQNLARELAAATAARDQAIAEVEDPARSRYERLLKTKGDNIVVGVAGGFCGGCHMKLTTQVVVSAKAQSEIVYCPSCARMLYFNADMG